MTKLISIITPCYNEEDNVRDCYEAVRRIFREKLPGYEVEHIFCDNASTDRTVSILKELAAHDQRLKIVVNARNFGAFRSMFNGLLKTRGDAVLVMLAADLQDPPEVIVDFVRKWEEGIQVVYGIRKNRKENFLLSSMRKFYYRLVNRLADIRIPCDAGEFQLIDRVVVEALKRFDDYYPYVRGMIASCGFKSAGIEYSWGRRNKGRTKTNWYHLIDQGLNGLISFANIPLRLLMLAGFVVAASSLLYAFVALVINLIWFRRFAASGIATLIVALFFFAGVQLLFLGLLGEYIGAIHFQVRKRPLVIEQETVNFD